MKRFLKSEVVVTGLAMFSMFFGAGNVVFPLAIGREAGSGNGYAMAGLLITAVGFPFLGLFSMVLFDGDYRKFFDRIGKVPGFLSLFFIVALIGPLFAMPRCVALSFGAIKDYLPFVSLFWFSIFSGLIIFVLSVKESKILDVLGYVLSPVLLISLSIIIVKGLLGGSMAVPALVSKKTLFLNGLLEGYNTMDLLASLLFSSVVLGMLRSSHDAKQRDYKTVALVTLKSAGLGASLLGVVYLGMSYVASYQGTLLTGVADDELLVSVARNVMGYGPGAIAAIAVALACLTTAITLAAVFTDFLRIEVCRNKISYVQSLTITIVVTTFIANYGFANIKTMGIPILVICYPAIMVLAVTNIAYKLFDFKYVKIPVFVTFVISIINYFS